MFTGKKAKISFADSKLKLYLDFYVVHKNLSERKAI